MSSPTDSPTAASHPFDNPKADIILRSADNVDFRVFKAILLLSSPVFETMLELPNPCPTHDPTMTESIPVIPFEESSDVLDLILRFCYPGDNPKVDSRKLELLIPVADKYCLDAVMRSLEADYIANCGECIRDSPVWALGYASRHGWHILAQKVAEASLYYTVDELISQSREVTLDGVGLTAFWGLLDYHLRIRQKLCQKELDYNTFGTNIDHFRCVHHNCLKPVHSGSRVYEPATWAAYVTQVAQQLTTGAPLRGLQESMSNPMKGLSTGCAGCLSHNMHSMVEEFRGSSFLHF
ncbi:hypothetical protein ONZ45_g14780 [Pleurotus djamor]|nr:hypothetical protein ONZ45_g14780 [Pleurotus djamor]